MEKYPIKFIKETIQPTEFRSQIVCLRPGGNDTALVLSNISNSS